jgi:hypothetical protein
MGGGELRVGCGSAYGEDDLDPAYELASAGAVDYLCFDGLAERTMALAQARRLNDPSRGYDLRMDAFAARFLPFVERDGLRIVTNMGAANPRGGAACVRGVADRLGCTDVRVGLVEGDDVLDAIKQHNPVVWETGQPVDQLPGEIVSANAYIGAAPIVEALERGANIVIAGRAADPSLFLAPMIKEFGWDQDDWPLLGRGTVIAHVLECGSHVTGGNFADPPYRVVPGLDRLGMPIAHVRPDGSAVITKLADAGGIVTTDTVKCQLVYEVHDPRRYLTPDVVGDFDSVRVRATGQDEVRVSGGSGSRRPDELKVLVGVREGFVGEGEISFAGAGAHSRAELCREVLRARVQRRYAGAYDEARFDLIGVDSVLAAASPNSGVPAAEVRVRVAARSRDPLVAEAIAREAEWQFFGPSGAGGVRRRVTEALTVFSTTLPRSMTETTVEIV